MLSPEQIQFFQDNGYLLVKGLISREEAAQMRRETHELAERIYAAGQFDATWGSAKSVSAQKTKLQHCHDVQFYSAAFARLIVDERFTLAASQVMQTPNVQLHHTKMFIKPPENGSPFPMHQDEPFFPHEQHSMIAAIFHFDDAPLEKGCVRVVPGSHKLGALEHLQEGSWHLSPEEYPVEDATPCPTEAGDVLFFSYLTIHGSGLNTSDEARTTLLVQMRDPEDVPVVRAHESRGQGQMLRGIDPTSCGRINQSASKAPVMAGMGMGKG
jgi:ectoine hydroxylase-related dioxygenase (phytanoyl-CoA dioxygenase family)